MCQGGIFQSEWEIKGCSLDFPTSYFTIHSLYLNTPFKKTSTFKDMKYIQIQQNMTLLKEKGREEEKAEKNNGFIANSHQGKQ